jgi:hypothetical protein
LCNRDHVRQRQTQRERERERERERSLLEAHPPTERQTRRRRGPRHLTGAQGGREGSWDQYTTDTIGDGIRSILVPTQFAIERKEVQYILRIGEICLE